MKKLGIAFIILFALIGIGIFSASSGNEQSTEPEVVIAPYTIRKSHSKFFKNPFWA